MLNRPVLPLRFAALPLLLCAALSCIGTEESGPLDSNASSAAPATPAASTAVTFEPRSVEKKDDPSSVSFSYPAITSAPSEALKTALTQAINDFLTAPAGDGEKSSTPEAAADEFLAQARSTRSENPDEALPWTLSRSVEIAYQDPKVVSLHLSEEVFQGGAHGLTTERYASFDPATGRRLGLSDLVTPEGEARLVEIGERELRKVHQLPAEQSLEEAGFTFEGNKFVLSEEIAVLAEGLAIHYNPYEIAPYALGPTEIVIPRSELAPIAKPGGPLN